MTHYAPFRQENESNDRYFTDAMIKFDRQAGSITKCEPDPLRLSRLFDKSTWLPPSSLILLIICDEFWVNPVSYK